jgi:hypothetical protein
VTAAPGCHFPGPNLGFARPGRVVLGENVVEIVQLDSADAGLRIGKVDRDGTDLELDPPAPVAAIAEAAALKVLLARIAERQIVPVSHAVTRLRQEGLFRTASARRKKLPSVTTTSPGWRPDRTAKPSAIGGPSLTER